MVLDLTPNYNGTSPWFSSSVAVDVMDKVEVGISFISYTFTVVFCVED